MRELNVTIYEFTGYLFPGVIGTVAIGTLHWSLCGSGAYNLDSLNTAGWIAAFVFSYFVGHFIQALANIFHAKEGKSFATLYNQAADKKFPPPVRDAVAEMAKTVCKLPATASVTPEVAKYVCNELIAQNGNKHDLDVFVYREGFYRGCYIAMLILFLSLIARLFFERGEISFGGVHIVFTRLEIVVAQTLLLLCAFLFLRRCIRFKEHKIFHSFYSALVLHHNSTSRPPGP